MISNIRRLLMNKITITKLIVLLSLIQTTISYAQTYYVDSTTGRDVFSGKSTKRPWASLTQIHW